MKKIILSLTSALFTCAAFAQSCVTIQQVSANYATNQVTFDLKWGTCNNTNHLYRVWVFVDYRPVTITTKGVWGRATISATDKGTLVSANKGVWVTGTANSTQRVTLILNVVGNKFDWCAFAIDYPPNATMANGVYTLKGTPPFTVNGAKLGDTQKTYTGSCISSITDATSNPDGFAATPPPTITGGASTVAVGSNVTWTGSPTGGVWSTGNSSIATVSNGVVTGKAVGSTNITYAVTTNGCTGNTSRAITVTSAAPPGSSNWTSCSGFSYISNVSSEGNMNWSTANTYCANKGMRLPTQTELSCMCSNKASLPGGYVDGYYWSSTATGSSYFLVHFANCYVGPNTPNNTTYIKCVK